MLQPPNSSQLCKRHLSPFLPSRASEVEIIHTVSLLTASCSFTSFLPHLPTEPREHPTELLTQVPDILFVATC